MRALTPLIAGLALASGLAAASGLQVSPVTLSLQPAQNADGLWLSNSGDGVVHAQARVYHWSQEHGTERQTPSRGLVVSPPMLTLEPGARQLVRVIRTGAPPNGAGAVEDAYRIEIDELPVKEPASKGLQFVLHYSLPVFVEPVGATAAPTLQWRLVREGDEASLEAGNSGSAHAQIAAVSFVDAAGKRTEISAGLLGYVLPGSTMRWKLKIPAAAFDGGGSLQAMINGEKATPTLSLSTPAR